MKYYGGKARLADNILDVVLADRKPGQHYVEPFVGGANVIINVNGPRIAADINRYVIALYKAVRDGWTPPEISEDEYYLIKNFPDRYPDYLVGWAGIGCTYRGVWFRGFSGYNVKNIAKNSAMLSNLTWFKKHAEKLKGIEFFACDYRELVYPNESVIYCDIPYYKSESGYKSGYKDKKGKTEAFDYVAFYDWCEMMHILGHSVFISEYYMPHDRFECIASWGMLKLINNSHSIENLYIPRGI